MASLLPKYNNANQLITQISVNLPLSNQINRAFQDPAFMTKTFLIIF